MTFNGIVRKRALGAISNTFMNDGSNIVEFVLPKPAIQFHSMFTEQVMEFVVLFKYVAKLVAHLSQKEKKEGIF